MRDMSRVLAASAILFAAPAHAGGCATELRAFQHMLQVSKFTKEGAERMFAAQEKALAFQKAGRDADCAEILARARRGE